MELVATSKLKRAQDRVAAARPYAAALTEVMGDLYDPELAERFPLLRQPPEGGEGPARRVALLLITSNRGLCGAFNANLIREARRRLDELDRAGTPVDLHVVGKKGRSEEHTSELQSRLHLVCRLLLEKKKNEIRQEKGPAI